jgi:hypothetical protein
MDGIDGTVAGLESRGARFTVESLANELKPEWIDEALRATDTLSHRRRLLPADLTVWLVVLMGLFRRTSYENLLEKLHGTWWTRDRWSPEKPPCTRAVTKARDRIGSAPMERVFGRSATEWVSQTEGLVVHGLRVKATDGSTMKTPDTKKNSRRFGRPGVSRGRAAYPQARIVTIADVGTRLIEAAQCAPYRKAEIHMARDLVGEIAPKSLILLDSGLMAYDLLWGIHKRDAHFIARIGKHVKPKVVRELGPGDAIVEVKVRSYHRRRHPEMPTRWTLRMITYRPENADEDIRLVTDLGEDTEFTRDELVALYHDRWEQETIFDELKTHLCDCATVNRPVVFRSKTPERVMQELWGLLIAYNVLRKTMCEAAREKNGDPRHIGFTAALGRTREATYLMMRLPTPRLREQYTFMLRAIARAVIPERPGRLHQRAVKIKMSNYPRKKECRRAA